MSEQVQKPKFWGQFMSGPQRRTPFNRSLPGLGGPQLLLAQPRLLVSTILVIIVMSASCEYLWETLTLTLLNAFANRPDAPLMLLQPEKGHNGLLESTLLTN